MALPCGTTGSLCSTFVPDRLVGLTVKHPYAFALKSAISDRAEGTFVLLRYSFGGDRPSQTTHQALSATRIHGPALEHQTYKGGISRTAPAQLASRLQSLPPILHKQAQSPVQSYSKGSRGLSV